MNFLKKLKNPKFLQLFLKKLLPLKSLAKHPKIGLIDKQNMRPKINNSEPI